MKRFYYNMSNEPKKYRTWLLLQDSVTEADFKWLKAFDIPIRIEAPEHTFDTTGGSAHTVYGKPRYTLDTTTDKQRDMLMLKYSPNILLIQEETILPGSMSTCTLSGVTW